MAKKKAVRKVKSGFSEGGTYYETPTPKVRKITKIRCDGCGRENSLKISSRADDGNHYMICYTCGSQPMLRAAKSAFKRSPEKEIVEAAHQVSFGTYDRNSRNPNHHSSYEGKKYRVSVAADRAAAEIKKLKKALKWFTEGGCYDGWTMEKLMKEYEAHGS